MLIKDYKHHHILSSYVSKSKKPKKTEINHAKQLLIKICHISVLVSSLKFKLSSVLTFHPRATNFFVGVCVCVYPCVCVCVFFRVCVCMWTSVCVLISFPPKMPSFLAIWYFLFYFSLLPFPYDFLFTYKEKILLLK